MASRWFTQYTYSPDNGTCLIHARVTIGATGAPTLTKLNADGTFSSAPTAASTTKPPLSYAAGYSGVQAISRTSTGLYVLTLQDPYTELLDFNVTFNVAGGISAVTNVSLVQGAGTSATANPAVFTFQCSGPTNSSTTTLIATDPDNGCVMHVALALKSSVAV